MTKVASVLGCVYKIIDFAMRQFTGAILNVCGCTADGSPWFIASAGYCHPH